MFASLDVRKESQTGLGGGHRLDDFVGSAGKSEPVA